MLKVIRKRNPRKICQCPKCDANAWRVVYKYDVAGKAFRTYVCFTPGCQHRIRTQETVNSMGVKPRNKRTTLTPEN
jgi:hypothetical protein